VAPLQARVESFKSTRLGGDMGWLFDARAEDLTRRDATGKSGDAGQNNRYDKRFANNVNTRGKQQ
jgi:hypothetical protein